jgi:hypothetical protein
MIMFLQAWVSVYNNHAPTHPRLRRGCRGFETLSPLTAP